MRDVARKGLERLGVLIGRTSTRRKVPSMFTIVGETDTPHMPDSMKDTQQIPIIR